MSGWVLCTRFLVPRFGFSCCYVDLKYDDVFVLWLIAVCEWVGGDLLVMGYCVVCAWCCCYLLSGCVDGASPVRFVLSLFYMCAFQMNPVCVFQMNPVCVFQMNPVCVVTSVVGPGLYSTSPAFVRSRASQTAWSNGRLVQKRNRAPISGARG